MSDFSTIVDAPTVAASEVTIAKLGDYHDKRYGDFSITTENVENWQKHLSVLPGGKAVIDLDHRSERSPRNSEAAGWINSVELRGDDVVAKTEWTSLGRDAISDKRYLFFSPVYGEFTDDKGGTVDDVLQSGALTNKPFQTKLPTISLASEERLNAALALLDADEQKLRLLDALPAAPKTRKATADSRRSMTATLTLDADTLTTLGVTDEAAQKKILDADATEQPTLLAEALKPDEPAQTKTLEQQAAADGKIVLDADAVKTLQAQAASGAKAAGELAEQKFTNAFDAAVRDGKAAPAQKELMAEMYAVKPNETLKLLDEAPQLFNVKPQGQAIEVDGKPVPHGVDPKGYELDQKVKAKAAKIRELGQEPPAYEKLYQLVMEEEAGDGGV